MRLLLPAVLCRVLLINSTVRDTINAYTVEFVTPPIKPTGVLLCFNDTALKLTAHDFSVPSLLVGGSLFEYGEAAVVAPGTSWTSNPFFKPANLALRAAEFGSLQDVLNTDSSYADSYLFQRLDSLRYDSTAFTSITGLVNFSSNLGAAPQPSPEAGNCVLLSGAWQSRTRYELSFTVRNPAGGASAGKMPALWLAPVTTSVLSSTASSHGFIATDLTFAVRGSKQGVVCTARPAVSAALQSLWDACSAARQRGLAPPPGAAPLTCLALLRSAQLSNSSGFPYTLAPLAGPSPPSCSSTLNSALSSRLGGDCVACGPGKPAAPPLMGCECPPGSQAQLVGSLACSALLVAPDPAATTNTSALALAAALCSAFTAQQGQWRKRLLPPKLVQRLLPRAFLMAATGLVDEEAWRHARAAFHATYLVDPRYPDSPSRAQGLRPSCNKCQGAATYRDTFTGKQVPVQDYQFTAMNVFRLIGYVLDEVAGQPCPSLWDRNNPLVAEYGPYDKKLCQPLAPFV
ncbi:hypothetical protein V8C86DRAFT_2467560 [Haematococcus lacustris]